MKAEVASMIEGQPYQHENELPLAREGIVTPGYFETFQARLRSGREFTNDDTRCSPPSPRRWPSRV